MDRIHSVTVTLQQGVSEQDTHRIVDAIRMIRGVLGVNINIRDIQTVIEENRRVDRLRHEIMNVIYPKSDE